MRRDLLRLVAITDNLRDGIEGLTRRAVASRRGGATMIQLRLADEGARTLTAAGRALIAALDIPVIVHARTDVALAAGAAGVHLGVEDLAVADIRRLCGPDFVIGRSAGKEEDLRAVDGADYVALGPAFDVDRRRSGTALGASELERLTRAAGVPVIAVGGISPVTAPDAIRAGACGVALISGIFGSPDPESAAREVRSAIER